MRPRGPFDPEFDRPGKGREKGKPRRRWLRECLIALVVSCPFWLLLWWPIGTSPNSGAPLGRGIPAEPPDEANRVVHPQGFSIILPPNWESTILGVSSSDAGEIVAFPRQLVPTRSGAGIVLSNYGKRSPTDLSDAQPVRFQGKPAFERVSTRPGVFLDSPPLFRYSLAFQRAGAWYELMDSLARDQRAIPQVIQQYFNTFRDQSGSDHGPRTTDHGQPK
jgi:hypothetical protein